MKISNPFSPGFTSTALARLALGFGASTVAIASAMLPQLTLAQSAGNIQNPGDFTYPQNERDSFGGGIGGSDFSVFDLIHNAQTGGLRDPNEVISEQRESIDKAADEFRRIQLERLRNSQLQQTGAPANPPAPSPSSY